MERGWVASSGSGSTRSSASVSRSSRRKSRPSRIGTSAPVRRTRIDFSPQGAEDPAVARGARGPEAGKDAGFRRESQKPDLPGALVVVARIRQAERVGHLADAEPL